MIKKNQECINKTNDTVNVQTAAIIKGVNLYKY